MTSTIRAVSLRRDFTYELLGDKVLVPTTITVSCTNEAKNKAIQMHPLALPFGLLERVKVTAATPFQCTIEIVKPTGRNKVTAPEILAVYADARDNQDAADPDLKLVRAWTGHVMQNRMIAAASVVGVLVGFTSDDVPDAFTVEYHGANVLDTVAEARSDGPKYAFRLPPLTPNARMMRGIDAKDGTDTK